jgi:hypothetical protein
MPTQQARQNRITPTRNQRTWKIQRVRANFRKKALGANRLPAPIFHLGVNNPKT